MKIERALTQYECLLKIQQGTMKIDKINFNGDLKYRKLQS